MAIKGAGTQAAPDDTTLVVYRGSRVAVDPERKRDLAKRCGVKFILLYNKPDRLHPEGSVSGFQKVELQVLPVKGGHGTEPFARWHKNEITQEPAAEGAMDFIADEFGQGRAYLPDSPFNRVRLAYAEIFQNSLWLIEDGVVAEEIRALATEIKRSIEFREEQEAADHAAMEVETSVLERNAVTGREVKSHTEIQNEVLRKKIAELEAKETQRELREKAARLQARLGGAPVETVAQAPAGPPPGAPKVEADDPMKSLRDQARADVYAANPELIESVKGAQIAAKGKASGWGFTPRFKQEIQPLIDKRFEELVAKESTSVVKEQDEHPAVGDVT